MKKYGIVCLLFLIGYCMIQNYEAEAIQIPNTAIRLRVIPNSNSIYDQEIKMQVKKTLEENTYVLLENSKTISDARNIVEGNLEKIKSQIELTLAQENYDKGYKINFGKNYFPEKTYKGITYEAGEYESLVVTLGEGKGDNWWCVLFPPLCLLEAEEGDADDVEYTFFAKELLKKFL